MPFLESKMSEVLCDMRASKTVHGDFWIKNLVVRHDEEMVLQEVKIIDFGHSIRHRLQESIYCSTLITAHTNRAPELSAGFITRYFVERNSCPRATILQQIQADPSFRMVGLNEGVVSLAPLEQENVEEILTIFDSQKESNCYSYEADTWSAGITMLDVLWAVGERASLVEGILICMGFRMELAE